MIEPRWILDAIVVSVHRMLVAEHGGSAGIRDKGLLDSALARPRQRFCGEPQATVFDLAASYGYGLARNHPFVDGNKRVALAVAAIFLEINGFSLDAPEPQSVIIIEQMAASKLSEIDLAHWLRDSSVPIA